MFLAREYVFFVVVNRMFLARACFSYSEAELYLLPSERNSPFLPRTNILYSPSMRQHVWVWRLIGQTFRTSSSVKRGAISCYEVGVTIEHECYVFHVTQFDVQIRIFIAFLRPNLLPYLFSQASPQLIKMKSLTSCTSFLRHKEAVTNELHASIHRAHIRLCIYKEKGSKWIGCTYIFSARFHKVFLFVLPHFWSTIS